jgi:protein required for attachment to host cells
VTAFRKETKMSKHKNLLIVIADSEHVRLVRPTPANVLHTERRFDSATAHRQSSDLGSDHPGASYHSDATAHHALAPRHDPHELEKEKFARFVAKELNDLPAHSFDGLVIAAPVHCLNIILETLHPEVTGKLAGTVSKDLAKIPDHELWPHLQEFVPPAAPARHK